MSYNIELVPARLLPFDWSSIAGNAATANTALAIQNNAIYGYDPNPTGQTLSADEHSIAQAQLGALGYSIGTPILSRSSNSTSGSSTSALPASGDPLYPLTLTGGLVFPFTPVISEAIGTKYDVVELTHTNESVHAYKNTDNVRIQLSDCVWTAETFDMAIYTLAVIHFFRSYALMDFGRGSRSPSRRSGTGRPPSPMWFYAYGKFLYHQVPVLIERIEFSMPVDVDYVGVPNPGTDAWRNQTLSYSTTAGLNSVINSGTEFTWVPIKFTIGSISMIVQHSVTYWTETFNLDDFKAGGLVKR